MASEWDEAGGYLGDVDGVAVQEGQGKRENFGWRRDEWGPFLVGLGAVEI